jgi:transcriptional regulator
VFVPDLYRAEDETWHVELIRHHPLATLVCRGEDTPVLATHLPAILERDALDLDDEGELVGATILGHMNRLNPQWSALVPAREAVLMFSGPGDYVSPSIYGVTPAAPTWDFTAVHLHGTVHPIPDLAGTRRVVQATARLLEQRFGAGWNMASSLEYFEQLLPGVGAFRMEITRVEGMFKLSQEQPDAVRGNVVSTFSGMPCHAGLARMMRRSMEAELHQGDRK